MHLNDESTTTCLDTNNNSKSTDSHTTINNNSGHSGDNDSLIIQSKSDCTSTNNPNPVTNINPDDDLLTKPGSSSDYPTTTTDGDQYNSKLFTNPIESNSLLLDDQLIVTKSLTTSIDDGQPPPTNILQSTNPNEISIMQDSTDLHWFNEETYQSEKTHLIENMPIISDSSTNTEPSTAGGKHHHHNRYHVLSRNIDVTLAEIDMETFTSEDINNIYSTLPELDSSCSGADTIGVGVGGGTVTEDGGEEFASVTGSLLDEIHSDNHYLSSKRFNSHGIDLNGSSSIFDSSLIADETTSVKTLSSVGCVSGGTLTMRSDRGLLPGLYERSHLDVSGVSTDSLDFSSSENDNNTNEVILRCREQDKTKYTIAFEESVSSVTTFSDSADDTKNNSEESDTVTHFNHHHHHHHHHYNTNKANHQLRRRRMNGVNFISVNNNSDDYDYDLDDEYRNHHHHHHNVNDNLVKSEYTTWNMVKRRGPIGRRELIKLRRYPYRPIAKQSQSLPNIVQVTSIITGDHGEPLFPPLGSYVPLYDLNKSTTNSSNSEVSPPRSLIRLFIKNRTSPTSSSPGSSSTSFEGHLIESSELIHGHPHHHHRGGGNGGQQSTLPSGNYGVTKRGGGAVGPNGQYYYGDKEGNLRVNCNGKRSVDQQCTSEDWNNFEDSLVTEGVTGNGTDTGVGGGGHVTLLPPPKTGFNRLKQASPIREEDVTSSRGDEPLTSGTDESYHDKDGKLINQHWPNYHFDKFKSNGTSNGNGNSDRVNIIGARRSISVDRFMSNQCTEVGCGGDDTNGHGIRGGGGCDPSSAGGGSSNGNINRRSSDYSSTNMNKIRFSSGREFGSVSSGYLSSRQGSSEWHRKTAFTHHPPSTSSQQQPSSQPKPSSSSSSLPQQYPLNPSSSSSSIPSKRYSISVTTMKTASTQVPVHIQDKQVQTATTPSTAPHDNTGHPESHVDPSTGFIIREYPTSTVRDKSIPLSACYAKETFSSSSDQHHQQHRQPQDEPQRAKPLYVCFPNYSLPDLSFLRALSCPCTPKDDQGPSAVYLSPTKLKLPLREFQSNPPAGKGGGGGGIGIGGIRRRPFGRGKGVRPKSCTDYENLIANRSFNHIKDWDSLKVLLPNEFKSLIARLEGGDQNQPEEQLKDQKQDGGTTRRSTDYPNIGKQSDVNGKRSGERSSTINTNPFCSNYKESKPITSPASEVKLRPRKRSVVRTSDGYPCPPEVNEGGGGGCGCHQDRKRHSLQEPPSDYHGYHQHPHHSHHPGPGQHQQQHHEPDDLTNCTYRNTISRSVTMPSCVCHNQQQPPACHLNCCQPYNYYHQQHHCHPYDHHHHQYPQQHTSHPHHKSQISPVTAVNSCCQGGGGVIGAVGGGGSGRSMSTNVKSNEMNSSLVNGLFDDPSVDRLCHLFSKGISVKDFTNLIGGAGTGNQPSSSVGVGGGGGGGGLVHKNRLTSPSKPYEPIKEQVIEETDSMCISSKGDHHHPHLQRSSLTNQPTTIETNCQLNSNDNNNQIKHDTHGGGKGDEDESRINSNFNVIKKRWESLASPVSSTINSPELNQPPTTINNTGGGGRGKNTTPPSTPSSNYSSPQPPPTSQPSSSSSSSTTTTSSSALPVKPKVPIKPPLSSLRPTSVPVAKRPTTLGANYNSANVFKSMIPIAKGSKSPPNVKQLTSPISKTLPRINSKKSSTTTQ